MECKLFRVNYHLLPFKSIISLILSSDISPVENFHSSMEANLVHYIFPSPIFLLWVLKRKHSSNSYSSVNIWNHNKPAYEVSTTHTHTHLPPVMDDRWVWIWTHIPYKYHYVLFKPAPFDSCCDITAVRPTLKPLSSVVFAYGCGYVQ